MNDPADRLYEQVLIVRCQTGDATAFAALVERYGPRLRYYLRKLLGRAGDAEDVLQDVWYDVIRALPRLADSAAFPAWVYRIARARVARSWRRPRLAEQPLAADELGDGVPGADGSPGDEFTAEDAALIHAALDGLAPEHREVLVLRFLEAMSYEDIAAVVGSSIGTVKSRIHYAKRALRRALEGTYSHE